MHRQCGGARGSQAGARTRLANIEPNTFESAASCVNSSVLGCDCRKPTRCLSNSRSHIHSGKHVVNMSGAHKGGNEALCLTSYLVAP